MFVTLYQIITDLTIIKLNIRTFRTEKAFKLLFQHFYERQIKSPQRDQFLFVFTFGKL